MFMQKASLARIDFQKDLAQTKGKKKQPCTEDLEFPLM